MALRTHYLNVMYHLNMRYYLNMTILFECTNLVPTGITFQSALLLKAGISEIVRKPHQFCEDANIVN
jgi:hypothetical protein